MKTMIILKKDGVYILGDASMNSSDLLVWKPHNEDWSGTSFFGGRINIKTFNSTRSSYNVFYAELTIDGIEIIQLIEGKIAKNIPISVIVSYLNAVEVFGIDSFMENYKKNVEFLYAELKETLTEKNLQVSSEHDEVKVKLNMAELQALRESLSLLLSILFMVYMYAPTSIRNEATISIYQSIVDSIA